MHQMSFLKEFFEVVIFRQVDDGVKTQVFETQRIVWPQPNYFLAP
jgi:hypothetical protein